MAFTAQKILTAARTELLDESSVRWPLADLLRYLNEGVRAIITLRPIAGATVRTVPLTAGINQAIPADAQSMLAVSHNVASGRPVKPVASTIEMDSILPIWRKTSVLPAHVDAVHVIYEPQTPRVFKVVPANTGTGQIEATFSVFPAEIATPASPDLIASYNTAVTLPDAYEIALIHYVTHLAYLKDAGEPASAARAKAKLDLFTQAMTAIAAAEGEGSLIGAVLNPK